MLEMERFLSQFRKGMGKYFRKSPDTLDHEILPKLGCSLAFLALRAGTRVGYA